MVPTRYHLTHAPARLEERYQRAPPGGPPVINLLTGTGWVVRGWGVPGPPLRRAEEDARLLFLKAGCEPTSLDTRSAGLGLHDVAAEQAT